MRYIFDAPEMPEIGIIGQKKGRKPSTDLGQPVDGKLTINSNSFVTETELVE